MLLLAAGLKNTTDMFFAGQELLLFGRTPGSCWAAFNRIQERYPLLCPKLHLPYRALQALVVL